MTANLGNIREYIGGIMAKWGVPGLAVAVIKDGDVLLCDGFGLRDIEKNLPVTPDTLMAIGSCSKAFTATAVAQLVDDGALEWDKPLRHYLPDWAMSDPFASDRMTARDLLCHRSGLPGHDFLWYNTMKVSREDLYRRIRHLQPAYDFRTTFHYQNLMFMAAGYLVEAVTGQTWEQFTRQRIFEPLGMKTSNFSVEDSKTAPDASQPYELKDGKVVQMAFANIDNIGPAGSINSSVREMLAWVQMQLNRGKYDGRQVVSEASMEQLHRPHIPIVGDLMSLYMLVERGDYCLGWMMQPHRGHTLIHHGGGIDGFSAFTSFMPDINAGMIVLTNLNLNPLSRVLTYTVYDRLLGIDDPSWYEAFKDARERVAKEEAEAAAKFDSARIPGTSPSHPLDDYVGAFENPGYGVITVQHDGDGLTQTYNDIPCAMKHYHYETFETVFEIEMRRHRLPVTYTVDRFGKVVSLAVPFEPGIPPVEFKRKT